MQRLTTLFLSITLASLINPTVSQSATISNPTVYLPSPTEPSSPTQDVQTTSTNLSDALASLTSVLAGNFPLNFELVPGALGLPDLDNYLSQVNQLHSQIPISTPFGNGNNATLLADLLADFDPDDSGLLLDIAIDGNILYSQLPDNNQETVVPPYRLNDRYYQLALGELATQTSEELALSVSGQAAINHILGLADISNTNSTTLADSSSSVSTDSDIRANTLSNSTQSISALANLSQGIANSSLTTDTSFQLLRNLSQQMGLQAQKNNFQAVQNQEIGRILANNSEQLSQQSEQLSEQQNTATHLLETAKQQQVLDSIQAATQGQQLTLLTQANTEQNRLDNAAFQHAQQASGMILIPLAPQDN